MVPGELHRARVAEEVGSVQEVDVERVALDPLGAVQEPAERPRGRLDLDADQVLEGVDRAHLVRDRADAADAGHDLEHLVGGPAHDERLEVARRLEDLQTRLADLPIPDRQVQGTLAFDTGEVLHLEAEVTRVHRLPPPPVGVPTWVAPLRRAPAGGPAPSASAGAGGRRAGP